MDKSVKQMILKSQVKDPYRNGFKNRLKQFFNNQRVVGLAFLGLSLGYLWAAQLIPLDFWSETEAFNARSMPHIFGYAAAVTSILLIVLPSPSFAWQHIRSLQFFPAICLFLLLTLYGFAIDYFGFLASTAVLLCSGFYLLGERNVVKLLGVSSAITLTFYTIMNLLGIYFTPGEFWIPLLEAMQ